MRGILLRTFLSRRSIAASLAALALVCVPLRASADDVTVFAAASLRAALDEVGAAWTAETGHGFAPSYGNSGSLARQVQQGAPADIYISANVDWVDQIEASNDLRAGTRRDILGNTLVLVAHGRDVAPVVLDSSLDLAGMVGDGQLAMPLLDAAPAGTYGREALRLFGLWDSVEGRVAQFDTVGAVLNVVALGEAPYGLLFATDAALSEDVTVIATFPDGSHEAIIYPAAVTAQATSPVAGDFLDFLTADTATAIWERYGFRVID